MSYIENKINLCFDLLKFYEEQVRNSILANKVNEEDVSKILKDFKFKDEILFSLNKEYKRGNKIDKFCRENNIDLNIPNMLNFHGSLYKHQENAIKAILNNKHTIVSTGTGSGKTESFLIPIFDYCLKNIGKKGIKAIIIYPMNALAGDQLKRIDSAVKGTGITYAIFSGQTPTEAEKKKSNRTTILSREEIVKNKPDILVTNYVMLERILINQEYRSMLKSNDVALKYVVLDEIHTYNGNKALHLKFLLNRLRNFIDNDVIQIGSSATLSRKKNKEKTDGYISGDISKFICNMFDLKSDDEYCYIEPVYEEIRYNMPNIKNLKDRKLAEDKKTILIKEFLYKECRTLSEILKMLENNNIYLSEKEIKEYFIDILNLNLKYSENPILDFRIHIFLLGIGKILKRCINCGTYYTVQVNKCNKCGHLLLPVYKKDTSLLLGALDNNEIKAPAQGINKKQNLVLLDFNNNEAKNIYSDVLYFDSFESNEETIKLIISREGTFKVYKDESIEADTLQLNTYNENMFLYRLLEKNLHGLKANERKILSFIDNRESCGRISTIFGDFLLGHFYYEIVKFINTKDGLDLDSIIRNSSKLLDEFSLNISDDMDINRKEAIKKDFLIWFRRCLVNKNFREYYELFDLSYKYEKNLSKLEKKILEIMLSEGLFYENTLYEFGKIIRIDKVSFEHGRGLSFNSFGGKSISLSDRAIKYKNLVNEYGTEKLIEAINGLLSKGFLVEVLQNNESLNKNKFGNSIFYLNFNKILLKTTKSNYNSVSEIAKNYLMFSGAHTSEVEFELKKEHEDDFQNGKLNLLFSTSTLEMGIDIGSLSFVYMLGVPPLPSNYAQRAGRAGRRGDRFAGIITICSEASQHDWYYFYNPKEIVEGLISPPRFDVNNKNVLNKHINTIIYSNLKDNIFSNISQQKKNELKFTCEKIFNMEIDIDTHINLLRYRLRKLHGRKEVNSFYKEAIYPEYCFNHKDVEFVISSSKKEHKESDEISISNREPEIAYKQCFPNTSLFIGEKLYKIIEDNNSKHFTSMLGNDVLSVWKYKCFDNEKNIKIEKTFIPKSDCIIIDLDYKMDLLKSKGPINIYYKDKMMIELISTLEQNSANKKELKVGYQLKRDAILLEFDSNVVSEEQYKSLSALLEKTIKLKFGLDENEISLIVDKNIIIANKKNENTKCKSYAILYDKSGNENIDFQYIANQLVNSINNCNGSTLLSDAYNIVINCTCEKDLGCYLCLKSYNTKLYSDKLRKSLAKNFIGYLIGKEKFKPQILVDIEVLKYEYELEIKISKGNFIFRNNEKDEIIEMIDNNQNKSIMTALYKKLKYIYLNDDIETIKIKSKDDYLVTGINGKTNINVPDKSFEFFNFYKQAFIKVVAEKSKI